MILTSVVSNMTQYFAQCSFFGDESLRYFAATMRAAKKTRCRVHGIPADQYKME
jgi:hypothetical protein